MDGAVCKGARIWLGDLEISNILTGLDVSFNVGEINRATLRILVDGLDIDAETLAVLQAHVATQAGENDTAADPVETTTVGAEYRTYVRPQGASHA